jgi:transitional endoplasmic reticulum ATPase
VAEHRSRRGSCHPDRPGKEHDEDRGRRLAATNRPDLVDAALLGPGRLERLVYVPPDEAARVAILSATTRRMPLEPGLDLAAVAAKCEGFSAADLEGLARRAAMTAMRESMQTPTVTAEHFEAARSNVLQA